MSWFRRLREGITTTTSEKKDAPEGVWYNCKNCNETSPTKDYIENKYICPKCDFHGRIGAREYFALFFDKENYEALFEELIAEDFLKFKDLKTYRERLKEARAKNDVGEAISVGVGKVEGKGLVIAAMNFSFIGGSMNSVVGEKIALAIDHCIEHRLPLMIISKSGGARMMESAFSLMQMAKTAAKLTQLSRAGLPYISLMTDPTTGGVTASFAMLGDLNIAEPKALIGFAGPRVIKETIKKDLPEGFQRSEFLLEKGFLDFIVHRKDLKTRVSQVLGMLQND